MIHRGESRFACYRKVPGICVQPRVTLETGLALSSPRKAQGRLLQRETVLSRSAQFKIDEILLQRSFVDSKRLRQLVTCIRLGGKKATNVKKQQTSSIDAKLISRLLQAVCRLSNTPTSICLVSSVCTSSSPQTSLMNQTSRKLPLSA